MDTMTRAHRLTRATIQTGDSYSATFALCLRAVHAGFVSADDTARALTAAGGKVWSKGGHSRVYITFATMKAIGQIEMDGGWVYYLTYGGARKRVEVGRRAARGFIADCDRLYFDVKAGKWVGSSDAVKAAEAFARKAVAVAPAPAVEARHADSYILECIDEDVAAGQSYRSARNEWR